MDMDTIMKKGSRYLVTECTYSPQYAHNFELTVLEICQDGKWVKLKDEINERVWWTLLSQFNRKQIHNYDGYVIQKELKAKGNEL